MAELKPLPELPFIPAAISLSEQFSIKITEDGDNNRIEKKRQKEYPAII